MTNMAELRDFIVMIGTDHSSQKLNHSQSRWLVDLHNFFPADTDWIALII